MALKFFYVDYIEDKRVEDPIEWPRGKQGILHSMDCVLHMPGNFCGIVNDRGQTLQFLVERDRTITVDVPVIENGNYVGSYRSREALANCLNLVENLHDDADFTVLPGLARVDVRSG